MSHISPPVQIEAKTSHSPWHIKFFDAAFAAVAILVLLNYPFGIIPYTYLEKYSFLLSLSEFLYNPYAWLVPVALGLGYSLYWHRKEKSGVFSSAIRHAQFRGLTRLGLAFLILEYGYAKLLGNQFQTSLYQQDTLISDLAGIRLVWYFFGYSRPFGLIIGYIQIVGAILLLFRRTNLPGVCLLLPVMLNIVLINFFYEIPLGAKINAVLITAGLVYLLLLHWTKIREFFLKTVYSLPAIRETALKNTVRFLIILLPFASAYQYHVPFGNGEWYTVYDPVLQGKWKVDRQEIDGLPMPEKAWASDTTQTIWSTMYFQGRDCFVNSHPYYYDPKTGKRADYSFDADKKALEIKFRGKKDDVFNGTVTSLQGDKMTVNGTYQNRQVTLALTRVKPPKEKG